MVIIVDQEGEKVVKVLLDIALKVGGMQNLPQINKILTCVKILPAPDLPKDDSQTQPSQLEEKEISNVGNGNKL